MYDTSYCPENMTHSYTADNPEIRAVVTELVERLGSQLESILCYPHPFTGAGLVVMFSRTVGFAPALIAEVYFCVPHDMPFYCLRSNELFQLSLPGQFLDGMWGSLNDHPHVAFWARHKGVILHGRDIREQIALPVKRRELLRIHIDRCHFYLRNMGILYLLTRQKYVALIKELDKHLRHVMATALLVYDEWDLSADEVPVRFEQRFSDAELQKTWRDFNGLQRFGEGLEGSAYRKPAFEAAWLFESFLRRLESYAQ
jgi:hypothetical protein